MSGELYIQNITGLNVFGIIKNSSGRTWNGTQFEIYNSSNYSLYQNSLTEQGSSADYEGDFPIGVTTLGHYRVVYYSQDGAIPVEGVDRVIGNGIVDWDGAAAVVTAPVIAGAMSGSDFYDYILRSFKRTDKETEVFDAIKDTIDNMRLRLIFPEDETDGDITDQISVLGEYRMDLEGDFGHLLSAVVLIDGDFGYTLDKISKAEYDRRYTGFGTGPSSRGRPKAFCIFGQKILVGPVPDQTSYVYKQSYAKDTLGTYTSASLSIPFTNRYREIQRWGVLQRLFSDILKNDDQAAKFGTLYEDGLKKIEMRNDRNRAGVFATKYRGN